MLIVRGVNVFPSAVREVVHAFEPRVSGNILVRPAAPGVKQDPPLPVSRRARPRRGARRRARGRDPRPAAQRAGRADPRRARAVGHAPAQRDEVEARRALDAPGAPRRHRHVPLHRRRRLDASARRARRRGLCGSARRASARDPRRVRAAGRGGGGHAGRLVLLGIRRRTRGGRGGGRADRRARAGRGACPRRPPHRRGARDRRGLRGPGRPSRRARGGRRQRRPGRAHRGDCGARRRRADRARRAPAEGRRRRRRALPARPRELPAAGDRREHEPAAPREPVRRPGAGARRPARPDRGRRRASSRSPAQAAPARRGSRSRLRRRSPRLSPPESFWVDLADLGDAAFVLETIARTLGARTSLAEHIADRRLLLVLDNFEHVVEAAPGLAALVGACPRLALLVTSRERLQVQGEVEYRLPPLAGAEAVDALLRPVRRRAVDGGRRAVPPSRRPAAGGRARRRAHERALARPDPRAARAATRPAARRPRRQPAPADAAGDARLVVRAALRRRAPALRPAVRVRGRLHARRRRGGVRCRPRHAAVAGREEPGHLRRRALLDAGDDPRVRRGAARLAQEAGATRRRQRAFVVGLATGASAAGLHTAAEAAISRRLDAEYANIRAAVQSALAAGSRTTWGGSSERSTRTWSRAATRPSRASGPRRRSPSATCFRSEGSRRRSWAPARSRGSRATSSARSS